MERFVSAHKLGVYTAIKPITGLLAGLVVAYFFDATWAIYYKCKPLFWPLNQAPVALYKSLNPFMPISIVVLAIIVFICCSHFDAWSVFADNEIVVERQKPKEYKDGNATSETEEEEESIFA
jgi:hypothetical protein